MELEDLKNEWAALSAKVNTQKLLTNQLIEGMTQIRYTQKFSTLAVIETFGALICFIAAVALFLNLARLDTWYLISSGILVAIYLVLLPAVTLRYLYGLKNIKIQGQTFKGTLLKYASYKKRILLIQRVGIVANFFILLIGIPVTAKLMNGNDIYQNFRGMDSWGLKLGLLIVFVIAMIYFSRWGYRCYNSITNSAEKILKEIQD